MVVMVFQGLKTDFVDTPLPSSAARRQTVKCNLVFIDHITQNLDKNKKNLPKNYFFEAVRGCNSAEILKPLKRTSKTFTRSTYQISIPGLNLEGRYTWDSPALFQIFKKRKATHTFPFELNWEAQIWARLNFNPTLSSPKNITSTANPSLQTKFDQFSSVSN